MGLEGNGPAGREEGRGAPFPCSWGGHGVRMGWLFPQGNAGAGHSGHKSDKPDPASGVAVPAGWPCQRGQAGARQRKSPKGPGGSGVGARRECKAVLIGTGAACQAGTGTAGTPPPPSAPSATRWKEQGGREGKHGGDPLLQGILPQISLLGGVEPALTPRAGTPAPPHPGTLQRRTGARGAMMPGVGGSCGEQPRAG